ncbi:dynamin family protein [Alkalihalobacillus sp. MEB130]|uniref:dynamin family protein n=1 Tax=Alkalihalobacillus sp. MEB130 TaxID=2976704 RepID=UPI0028E03C66|nr:dynamin family protein [Alkalihalobacillus sp. MEB130]MDT8859968.1 dynamin family protein [Alkalihalobacillus sp. MEB130]
MSKAVNIETPIKVVEITEKEMERQQIIEKKKKEGFFQVSFCGHFSAGKSTILNYLLGADMLPTSPIPTSANVIGIKNGELALTVDSLNGDKKQWNGEIPWQRVREWGMNGREIASLTIEAPLPFLGNHSIIYDTPGVDSTDPTHQAVTLEALYSTDFIVYVMDYNHVQSETNLTFLKQLSDEKKPLYLIVNQIDKHDEKELSYETFDRSVRDTFQAWGINILKLLYTSMKDRTHPLNQLAQFERDMKAILYYGGELLPYAKQRLQQGLYLSMITRLQEEKEDELDQVKDSLKQEGFSIDQLEKRHEVAQLYEATFHKKKQFEEGFEKKWQDLVKDVTIFPYTTTELVRSWFESIEPGFKVGFLFSKKKTEEEQETRLNRLIEETQDKVKSQLVFHLHHIFQSYDFTKLSNRDEVERELEQLFVTIDRTFFEESVQTGPKNREYVYTYTKERTQAVIKQLRQKAASVIDLFIRGMEEHWEKEQTELEYELEKLHELDAYVMQLSKIEDRYQECINEKTEKVSHYQDAGAYERVINEAMEKELPEFPTMASFDNITLPEATVIDTEWDRSSELQLTEFDEEAASNWVRLIENTIEPYLDDERMSYERLALQKRIRRFKDQTFTISLFGAFSAGKSSFANALLGETVLPVSPHPTTATVNMVKRSEQGHASRTAVVQVKTKEQLAKEIESVTTQLDRKVTLESIQSWKEDKTATTSWQKTYQAYLTTLKNSLADRKWELGSSFEVTLEALQPFVANEHDACLIEQVTLYYDCPLTEKGIILVDTPGVNSIHGRHTNVAFKQLRDSDAIFYLTYYNHAFSKADQQFLQQMAKVNEGFRTDKLYFILNAADLASSPYELNGVKKHVYDQLVQNGVQQPRLYPLSSKQGLIAKQAGRSEDDLFSTFEKAFYQNTITELKRLSFELVKEEVGRYQATLEKGLEYATGKEQDRERKRSEIQALIANWSEKIRSYTPLTAEQMSKQEVSQLFLYLRDRIRYVLGDQFGESINVSTIVGNSKKAQQLALDSSLKEWRSEGEHFIKQELQATFVRIELALNKAIEEWIREMTAEIRKEFHSYSITFELEKLDVSSAPEDRFIPIELEPYSRYFQSLKSFFEQGKVKQLKEDIVEEGTKKTGEVLRLLERNTQELVQVTFEKLVIEAKKSMTDGLNREIERFDSLTDPKHLVSLQKELHELKKC